jgi:hypothetical protein
MTNKRGATPSGGAASKGGAAPSIVGAGVQPYAPSWASPKRPHIRPLVGPAFSLSGLHSSAS